MEKAEKIIKFLQQTFKEQGFDKGLVGVSGGIDSAVSLILAVKALGKDNVFAVEMPYKNQNMDMAKLLIEQAGIKEENRLEINIGEMVDEIAGRLKASEDKIRLGNIMARVRMIISYDLAKKHRALVIGTANKSEKLLGYYSRFGDEAADIEPIGYLYKTQIYELGKYLGINKDILQAEPTGGLWLGQTDAKELGFGYKQADPILKELADKKTDINEIMKKFDENLVKKIEKRLKQVEFKSKVPFSLV